jgi:hypothetical protein
MARLLREVIDSGAPPRLARLPMTPEEVAASYAEAGKAGRPEFGDVEFGVSGDDSDIDDDDDDELGEEYGPDDEDDDLDPTDGRANAEDAGHDDVPSAGSVLVPPDGAGPPAGAAHPDDEAEPAGVIGGPG